MIIYHFAVHNNGTGFEDLGFMTLADDSEALVFGQRVIRDMTRRNAKQYAGWSMESAQGKRAVHSLPFDVGRQKKYA
jgi:hypothetical protein